MGVFSDFGDLATLGLTAYNPLAGVIGGSLIGKMASKELQDERNKQRAKEMAAKASIIGTQWAPRAVSPDVVSVTPWKGDEAASAVGSAGGVGQALSYIKALKDEDSGLKGLFSKAAKGAPVASNSEPDPQEAFVSSPQPQRNIASVPRNFMGPREDYSGELPSDEGIQTIFGILAKGRNRRMGQEPVNY